MTTLREAAQQALEALEYDTEPEPKYGINAAITALRAALEQEKKWDLIAEMHNVEDKT